MPFGGLESPGAGQGKKHGTKYPHTRDIFLGAEASASPAPTTYEASFTCLLHFFRGSQDAEWKWNIQDPPCLYGVQGKKTPLRSKSRGIWRLFSVCYTYPATQPTQADPLFSCHQNGTACAIPEAVRPRKRQSRCMFS